MPAPFPIPAHWTWRPSPNHNGRGPSRVTAIVLHADAAADVAASLDWVQRQDSKVSYHVLIGRNGKVYVTVAPDQRAWHAGVSELGAETDCNTFAVGVCLSNKNDGHEPYPAAQVAAAAEVCAALCRHYHIARDRIVTHAAVARPIGRKTDPVGLDLLAFRGMVEARLSTAPLGGW